MGYSLQLYVVCVFSAIGGFCFGYDSGIISGVLTMPYFISMITNGQRDFLYSIESSVITGLLLAGCFVGALFASPLCENLSRKYTLIVSSFVFIFGAGIQTGAHGYGMILGGRFVAGLGVGSLSMSCPLYLSELAPKEIRGRLIALQQLMIAIGLMVAFWVNVGTQYLESDASWRVPLGIQMGPAAVLGFGAVFLPFSPRWLVSKGRNEEALSVLARLHSNGDETAPHVVAEFEEIKAQVAHENTIMANSYSELFKGTNRRRVFLGIMIQVFQQLTGINSIMYYAPTIFQQAGVASRAASLIASGVNGVLNVFATVPALLFLDRFGRRKVLISGALVMGVTMLLCGIVMAATGKVTYDPSTQKHNVDMSGNIHASYFCIVMVYFFVAGFAYSWGPVGWVYPAEIFSLSIRAKGTSLSTASNWLMNFIISLFVPVMLANITWGTYLFFGCCSIIMSLCVFLFYPETKGRSLEEMDIVFSGSVWAYKDIRKESVAYNVTKVATENSFTLDVKDQA